MVNITKLRLCRVCLNGKCRGRKRKFHQVALEQKLGRKHVVDPRHTEIENIFIYMNLHAKCV